MDPWSEYCNRMSVPSMNVPDSCIKSIEQRNLVKNRSVKSDCDPFIFIKVYLISLRNSNIWWFTQNNCGPQNSPKHFGKKSCKFNPVNHRLTFKLWEWATSLSSTGRFFLNWLNLTTYRIHFIGVKLSITVDEKKIHSEKWVDKIVKRTHSKAECTHLSICVPMERVCEEKNTYDMKHH